MQKNKIKTKIWNNFGNALFYERRFVFQRSDQTPDELSRIHEAEMGVYGSLTIAQKEKERQRLDEITRETRLRVSDTLAASDILDVRVKNRLRQMQTENEEDFREIANAEMERSYRWFGGRKRMAEYISKNHRYWDLLDHLNVQIRGEFDAALGARVKGIGVIGGTWDPVTNRWRSGGAFPPATFLDDNNSELHLDNANARNSFSAPDGSRVIIQWNQEPAPIIEKKLKDLGIYEQFIQQNGAQEFMQRKRRHTLIEKTIYDEISSLSELRYDSKTLNQYLELEEDQLVQASPEFQAWMAKEGITPPVMTPDQERKYNAQIKKMRPLVAGKSIKSLLTKLLKPNTLQNLERDDPEKTQNLALISYVTQRLEDPEDSFRVRNFFQESAGDYTSNISSLDSIRESLDSLQQTVEENIEQYNELQTLRNSIHDPADGINATITNRQKEYDDLNFELKGKMPATFIGAAPLWAGAPAPPRPREIEARLKVVSLEIDRLKDKKVNYEKRIAALVKHMKAFIDKIRDFGSTLALHRENDVLWGDKFHKALRLSAPERGAFTRLIKTATLKAHSLLTINDKIGLIESTYNDFTKNFNAIGKLTKGIEARKTHFEEQTAQIKEIPATDARTLLNELTKNELANLGETVETGLYEKATLRANMHIAACNTAQEALAENEAIKESGEKWFLGRWLDRLSAARYYSPKFTFNDATFHIKHTVGEGESSAWNHLFDLLQDGDTTLADMNEAIKQYEKGTGQRVHSGELERLAAHYQAFVNGMTVDGKEFKLITQHVPKAKNAISNLRLLAEEITSREFITELHEREMHAEEKDRTKIFHELLEEKNERRRDMEAYIKNIIEGRGDSRFRDYLIKANVKDVYKRVLKDTEDFDDEMRESEMIKEKLVGMRSRGMIATEGPHAAKEVAKGLGKGLGYAGLAVTAPIWGIPYLGYRLFKWDWWQNRYWKPYIESKKEEIEKFNEMKKHLFLKPVGDIAGTVAAAGVAVGRIPGGITGAGTGVLRKVGGFFGALLRPFTSIGKKNK